MKPYLLTAILIIAVGCTIDLTKKTEDIKCQVRLSLHIDGSTKGALVEDSSDLKSLQVCTYEKGSLVNSERYVDESNIVLNLTKGHEYDIFLLGNTDSFTAPGSENDITYLSHSISDIDDIDMNQSLPVMGKLIGVIADDSFEELTILLRKLVSRIRLSVNTEALPGLEVKNVCIKQSPLVLYPFQNNGSWISDSSQATDGDYATEEECEILNNGGEILLYTFENRQGTLLPDNEDSWGKVPEAIGKAAGLCTYLEMDCVFNDSSPFRGTVKYRFYLGNDECSNFDVVGGKEHQIAVILSNSGLEKDSWKIVADYDSRVSVFSRLEIEGVKKLCTGSSTRLSVRKYTDTYIDGILSNEDTTGELIDNSEVLWSLPEYDKAEASISQDGTLTGLSSGTVTINVSLLSDSDISGAGAVVIRDIGTVETSPDWDETGSHIAIEI